jgi:hypothetical protein
MSTEPHRLHLPDQASDAEILALVKRALRDADQSAALAITGSFAGEVKDAKIHGEVIGLLVDAPVPVFALPSEPIEQRGVAFILAADRAILGPETQISSDWRSSPGLASLLHHKFGPVLAKSIVFDISQDLLAHLVEHGQAVRSSDPDADVQVITSNVRNGVGRQLKRAFKAASELPLKEAIKFDLWFASSRKASSP